jgi:hypothetical protein
VRHDHGTGASGQAEWDAKGINPAALELTVLQKILKLWRHGPDQLLRSQLHLLLLTWLPAVLSSSLNIEEVKHRLDRNIAIFEGRVREPAGMITAERILFHLSVITSCIMPNGSGVLEWLARDLGYDYALISTD